MVTRFQPRPIVVLAAVLLTAAGGCQAGIGRFVPGLGAEADPLASAKQQRVLADKPTIPTPKVTARNYAQVQMALGDSLAKEGNFKAAQAAYEAALRNDDSLARAYHRLALMHEKTGHGSESKELFLRAIACDPKNAEVICDYGYWCYLRQDWDESQNQFQRALKLDPGMMRAHNNLGLVCARTDRPDDALKHFELAGLSPADGRANLGFVYLTQERIPEAKVELERAVAASPSSEKARVVLASLEKVERTAAEPKRLPSLVASAPPAKPPVNHQFNPAPPAVAKVATHIPMASKPADELSIKPQSRANDIPTRNLAPVLANYPFWDTGSTPASGVTLTEFADQSPVTSTVSGPDTPSSSTEPTIRFLPPPSDAPPGA
jgi:Tfp pilus assembly protein PilF